MREDSSEVLPVDLQVANGSLAACPSDSAGDASDLPETPAEFSVGDADTASWLLRKINESRAHVKRVQEWASREIKHAERDEEFLLMRFGRQLETWAAKEIGGLRGRRRSVSLPGGTCGFRRIRPVLVVDNEHEVITWARAAVPSAVVTVERLSKAILNQHFETTGELPAKGAHAQPAYDKFYIR